MSATKRIHRFGKFKGGYNYRGYCVYRTRSRIWHQKDEDGNGICYYKTLKDFKRLIDALIERAERGEGGQ